MISTETARGEAPTDAEAVELLLEMLRIPSPSYHESALAERLRTVMSGWGFDARIDAAGNVIGELDRGPGPSVLLLGHMDTIDSPMRTWVDGERVHGRGSVDAKSPLATMICAAAGARDFGGRVTVVGAVEEETPASRGAVRIREDMAAPDALVIGEPSGWSTVVLGYKGKLDLRYRVTRPATHPSNPEPKATELAAAVWSALLDELGPDAGHARFGQPGATLVSITGDLESAEAELSIRTPPGFVAEDLVAALRRHAGGGELTVLNAVAACRTGRTDPVVRALAAGIRDAGEKPAYKLRTATSDMNTLAERWAVPMATYGPGDSRLDHADDEHVTIPEFLSGISVLTHALTELTTLEKA